MANRARLVCFGCTVRAECRWYRSITGDEHGVWAGELFSTSKDNDKDSEADDT